MYKQIQTLDDFKELIQLSKSVFENKQNTDYNKLSELLINNLGNMAINAHLKNYDLNDKHIEFLYYFTEKTKRYNEAKAALTKVDTAIELQQNKIKLNDYEKLTLSEINEILRLEYIKDYYDEVIKEINQKCSNSEFNKLFANIEKAKDQLSELQKECLKSQRYKSGDLVISLNPKSFVLKNNHIHPSYKNKSQNPTPSGYNFAGIIFISKDNTEQTRIKISNIWNNQQSKILYLEEILESNIFRVDPTKLVDKKQIKNLEKIDYGYKKDKNWNVLLDKNGNRIKETWQNVMKARYEQLSNRLHINFYDNLESKLSKTHALYNSTLKELKSKRILHDHLSEKLKNTLNNKDNYSVPKEYNMRIQALKDYKMRIQNEISTLDTKINGIKPEQQNNKENNKVFDNYHLTPQTILEDHQQFFSENDFKELSEKMVNAEPDKKMMISSEFAAKSIVSVIDQLNKLTSFDLKSFELITKQQNILKEPISKNENFNNLHPEYLFNLLEKTGCIKKIQNKYLEELVLTKEENKKPTQDEFNSTALSKEIYSLLQSSSDFNKFYQDTSEVLKTYIKRTGTKEEILKQKDQVIKNNLKEIYNQYKKEPNGIIQKINRLVNQILEFCKLRTKDKEVRIKINNIIKKIKEPEIKFVNNPPRQEVIKKKKFTDTIKSKKQKNKISHVQLLKEQREEAKRNNNMTLPK